MKGAFPKKGTGTNCRGTSLIFKGLRTPTKHENSRIVLGLLPGCFRILPYKRLNCTRGIFKQNSSGCDWNARKQPSPAEDSSLQRKWRLLLWTGSVLTLETGQRRFWRVLLELSEFLSACDRCAEANSPSFVCRRTQRVWRRLSEALSFKTQHCLHSFSPHIPITFIRTESVAFWPTKSQRCRNHTFKIALWRLGWGLAEGQLS